MSQPFTVSFDKSRDIVIVRVVGRPVHDDHCAAQEETLRMCREAACSRILVDLTELSTERSSTMDCFSFGEEIARHYLGFRLAHVLPLDPESKANVRFITTVEANRGIYTREFECVADAERWLLEGSDQGATLESSLM